ncbi:ferritin-like domain-containing protein [Spirillospora sp. CA-294931]|uniref:ferritin-like domain-containing protein n=1 Tax=Spirillospora sp. CA-294931 TaxID=3240042 RepID=UPI003D8EB703
MRDEGDPLWVLNEYRAAEVHGAGAIMRMGRLADSAELGSNLTRHLRDEAVHAWLWTKAIENLGGEIVEVDLPYQARLGVHYGIPGSLTELLALTWVSERRGVTEYNEHLDTLDVTPAIQKTLRAILRDEEWHVSYIEEELLRRMRRDGGVQGVIDRAMAADDLAMADLRGGEAA